MKARQQTQYKMFLSTHSKSQKVTATVLWLSNLLKNFREEIETHVKPLPSNSAHKKLLRSTQLS